MTRIIIACVLALLGAWAGSHLIYLQHNPLFDGDPASGTFLEQTPENAWRWWLGFWLGAFIGGTTPFIDEPFRHRNKKK